MKKGKRIAHRQRQRMSTQMKLVIGAGIFAASFAGFLAIDLSDSELSTASQADWKGEYRVIENGEWNDTGVWEMYDGENWVPADEAPGSRTKKIIVTAGTELVIAEDIASSQIVVEKGGVLKLHANSMAVVKSGGKGGLFCSGELYLSECILEGNGDFILDDEAVLHIGSPEGIDKRGLSGNVQLRGVVSLSKNAAYFFDGTVKQSSGNGLPADISQFTVDNPFGLFLQSDLSVVNLHLIKGIFYTGPNKIKIGASRAASGSLTFDKGYIQGTYTKWYGAGELEALRLVAGDEGGRMIFTFKTEDKDYRQGKIEIKYHPGKPDEGFTSPFAAKEVKIGISEYGYFTARLTDGPDDGLLTNEGNQIENGGNVVSSWKIINPRQAASGNGQEKLLENFLLGPNPFQHGFELTFTSGQATMATMQLVNKSGKVIHSETIPVEEGKNKYSFKEGDAIPSGNYVLRISNPMEIHTLVASKK